MEKEFFPRFPEKTPPSEERRGEKREEGESLPVLEYKEEIKEAFLSSPAILVVGETGSGKTTQIPQILLEALPEREGKPTKIVVTQPRRVAAISVARFVASQRGERVGGEVGYQIRFDDHTSEGTRLNFVTDGILLRYLQEDPLLRRYDVVMVDEAHERSLNIDFLLGLLKRAQRERKKASLPPLKVVVASATLEKEKFQGYFPEAPLIEIPGRLYPVEIHYHPPQWDNVPSIIEKAGEVLKQILSEYPCGDVLVFMPGEEEINRTIQLLQEIQQKGEIPLEVEFLPLFARLSPEDQDLIFHPGDKRRVIVATNIAETSVTVPRIEHVVDSGLIKQTFYNPATGITTLETIKHSQSGCLQRTGRAGRIKPGHCWRLFSEEDFNSRPEHTLPEIQRSDLSHVVLAMLKMGLGLEDIRQFEFIDPPEPKALEEAIKTLTFLGAIEKEGKLTPEGELMAELPLEPKLARMIIEAEKHHCVEEVCTIASFLSASRSVFVSPKERDLRELAREKHQAFFSNEPFPSDFLAFLRVWEAFQEHLLQAGGLKKEVKEWAKNNFLSLRTLEEVSQIRRQLLRILRRNGYHPPKEKTSLEAVGKAITAGLLMNLMSY
ncbi:ATP-dependent RNA helicase, partial [bacterium]|nr:ATP-dependent RNA helicase [bacterium]